MTALPARPAAQLLARAAMRHRALGASARHVELESRPAMTRRPRLNTATARSRPPRCLRYAVIGLGHIAQVAVLPAFAHARNAELVALVSGDPVKLQKLGDKYDVPHRFLYDDLDACLASDEIDAVYVALPNDLHYECCLRAAAAGKHILCEKPLAVTVHDAEEMLAAAERAGVKLMTAYRLHFEPANLAAIEAVRSGKIGEVRYFNSTFSYQITDPENIRLRADRGGGPIYDIGVYCINAARYLLGDEPEEVSAFTANSGDKRFREVEESAAALLRFPGGRLATFVVSFGSADSARYEIVGTEGSIVLDPAYEYSMALEATFKVGENEREKKFPHTDQFAGEIEEFSRDVLGDREPEPNAREGIADLRIIDALFESAKSGRAVRLKPFTKRRRPGHAQQQRKPPAREPRTVHVSSPHE